MDKKLADKIISEYLERIYGFAYSKTKNIDKAEELASRITFDVYKSLLNKDQIENVNGYIFKISQNVYARYVAEEKRRANVSLDEVKLPHEPTQNNDEKNLFIRIRKAISLLGEPQRQIVVMYYFQKRKQSEIANYLKIPLGTVKWHLHEAKKRIEGEIDYVQH